MLRRPLRFATFLAPNMLPVYHFIADYIGTQLDYPTELSVGTSFAQFAADEIDIGFICGRPYVQLVDQHPSSIELLAAPVLTSARYGGRPIYFSDVITRHTGPWASFADLRGCSWAYNDCDSHSGYGIVQYQLATIGAIDGYFGRVVEAGWHQRSIRLVCDGLVDATAIDSQVLAIELRDHPELATQLKIIDSLGPSPIQPVVAARALSAGLKAELQRILTHMGSDPAATSHLAHGYVGRFEVVNDADYNDIRAMMVAAAAVTRLTPDEPELYAPFIP